MNDDVRSYIVEFIGPFALMFVGGGAIIATDGRDLLAIALAHGLAIGLMIAAAGHISGGVYNPAITIGLMATRKLPPVKGLIYIVMQCLGATVAAAVLRFATPGATVNVTPTLGPGVSVAQGFVVELILTFFLMFAIFGSAIDKRGPATIAGLVIGLTISIDILVGGPITGASMNPARSFGPAVVYGVWNDHWLYWIATSLGAVLAALLYNDVLLGPDVPKIEPAVQLPQEAGSPR